VGQERWNLLIRRNNMTRIAFGEREAVALLRAARMRRLLGTRPGGANEHTERG
jgi:hypothetical protein